MRASTTIRLLVAGLTLATVTAVTALTPGRAGASADPEAACPQLYLYGVRGTGEAPGLGLPIGALATELEARMPGDVQAVASTYPASGIDVLQGLVQYKASVQAGRQLLNAELDRFASECPDADVAVVGYSQGADVVRRGLVDRGSPAGYKVILLGDPNMKASETTIRVVDENRNPVPSGRSGVAYLAPPLAPVPGFPPDGDAEADDLSVCRVDDPICGNALIPNWDLSNGPHNSYHLDASWLAQDIADWSGAP
jgi:Cutinase